MKKNQFENFMKEFFSLFLIKLFNLNQSLNSVNLWENGSIIEKKNNGEIGLNKLKLNYKSDISRTVFGIKFFQNDSTLIEQFKNFIVHFFFLIWINFFFQKNKILSLGNLIEIGNVDIPKPLGNISQIYSNRKKKIFSLKKLSSPIYKFKNAKLIGENSIKKNLPIKKLKINSGVINLPVLLKKVNNFVYNYSLRGFTKDSIRIISFLTNSYTKNLILDLGKISLLRQKNSKKFRDEYGMNALQNLKEPFLSEDGMIIPDKNFYCSLKHQIKFYKKKHLKINLGQKKDKIQIVSSHKKKQLDEKKKKHLIIEENMKKTNNTLFTLLNGILQKRIAALKETTKCLCKYEPLPTKLFSNIKNKTFVGLELPKKNTGMFRNKILSRSMVTGLDCINLMKNQRKYFNDELLKKMVSIVGFDYNLRFDN